MTDRDTLRERIELAIARNTFSRAAAAILADIETTHVLVSKAGDVSPKPTIVQDFGDFVIVRCDCGRELGFCPPGDDRERACHCGRRIWLTQMTDCGYVTSEDPT